MTKSKTLLTSKNLAYANVCTFGTSVLLDSQLSSGWNEILTNLIISQLSINKQECAFIDVTKDTDLPKLAGVFHSEITCSKILFIYISKQDLINDTPVWILDNLENTVMEYRNERALSTFIVMYGGVNHPDEGSHRIEREVTETLSVFTDVQLTVNMKGDTPDDIEFRSKHTWSASIVPFLTRKREFDVDNWENVGFLDIDNTVLVGRTFIRTKWGGLTVSMFSENPIDGQKHFDQELLAFIRKISALAKVKWVLSSVWRLHWTEEEVQMFGNILGIPIVGKTETLYNRNEEIETWLKTHKPGGIAVTVDDEDLHAKGTIPIQVHPLNGADWDTMTKIADAFGVSIFDCISSGNDFLIPSK